MPASYVREVVILEVDKAVVHEKGKNGQVESRSLPTPSVAVVTESHDPTELDCTVVLDAMMVIRYCCI